MSWGDAFWLPHTVQVRDIKRTGAGPQPGAPRELRAEVLDEQAIVRDASGEELVSSTRVTVALDANVAPGALVTVWAGTTAAREAVVLSVSRDVNDPPLPSHLVLRLK